MNQASISYTRNHLSAMLARVREGETILIVDRNQPVARLEPVAGPVVPSVPWQADLVRRGWVRPGRSRLDVKAFCALPLPTLSGAGDILAALQTDREEGR